MIYLMMILIGSFLLEGIFSLFVPMLSSYFFSLFTLIALISIFPYVKKQEFGFERICIFIGFAYDLIYTNTVCIHAFLFFIFAYLVRLLYHFFKENIWNQIMITLILIISYRVLSFLLLIVIGYLSADVFLLWNSIIGSIFINLIYSLLLYVILQALKKRKRVILYY